MRSSILLTAICLSSCAVTLADEPDAEQLAREKAFSERMANTVMIGSFTIDGQSDGKAPKAERYEIESVTKVSDGMWVFNARVKYGNFDQKLPFTVPMEWAGDTPMVSLTDQTFPLMEGKFSARVLFHKDRYAGTWDHDQIGGHMFGRIEKAKNSEAKEQTDRK
ncbi:MAG: hypothetical protein R3C19_02805 [Planctomycetaceae bacterium]